MTPYVHACNICNSEFTTTIKVRGLCEQCFEEMIEKEAAREADEASPSTTNRDIWAEIQANRSNPNRDRDGVRFIRMVGGPLDGERLTPDFVVGREWPPGDFLWTPGKPGTIGEQAIIHHYKFDGAARVMRFAKSMRATKAR